VTIAFITAGVGAFIRPGADRFGGLGLDQLLEDQAHGITDQLDVIPERNSSSRSDRADSERAIGCISFSVLLAEHTENRADGSPKWGPRRLLAWHTPKPPTIGSPMH